MNYCDTDVLRIMKWLRQNGTTIPVRNYFQYYRDLESSGFCRLEVLEWLSDGDNCLEKRRAFIKGEGELASDDAYDVVKAVMTDVYSQYGRYDDGHNVVRPSVMEDFVNYFATTERTKAIIRLAFDAATLDDKVRIGAFNVDDRLAVQIIWRFCDPYMRLLPFRLDWSCIDRQYALFQMVFAEETCDTVMRLVANYYRADSLFKMAISPGQYSRLQLEPNQSGFKVIEHLLSVLNNLGDLFKLPIESIKSQRATSLEKGCREIKKRLLDADKELEGLIFKQFSGGELEREFHHFISTTYYKYLMAREATRIKCNSESNLAYMRNWLEVHGNCDIAIATAIMDGAMGLYKGPKTLMKIIEWLADGFPFDETRQVGDVVLYCRWPVQYLLSKGRLMLMKTIWGVEF